MAWLLKLLDMHHGEAVLMPLDAYDTPWEWKGLSELWELRLVPHRTWPDDVADYLSKTWPFNHHCCQWRHYKDEATFADTLTASQYVPRVGRGGGQPCRILARPSDAR